MPPRKPYRSTSSVRAPQRAAASAVRKDLQALRSDIAAGTKKN